MHVHNVLPLSFGAALFRPGRLGEWPQVEFWIRQRLSSRPDSPFHEELTHPDPPRNLANGAEAADAEDHLVLVEVIDQQRTVRATPPHVFRAASGLAGNLHRPVELIGPHPWQRHVRFVAAKHVPAGKRSLILRILPALQAHARAGDLLEGAGVSRGIDEGVRGPQETVHSDAVVDFSPAASASAVRGETPTEITTAVHGRTVPSSRRTQRTRQSPSNSLTWRPRTKRTSLLSWNRRTSWDSSAGTARIIGLALLRPR